MVAVAVAAAFLSQGSLATIFCRTSMQKAILMSRIQFTTLLKVISEGEGGRSVDEFYPGSHAGKATWWLPVATANSLINPGEQAEKGEAVACRDVDGPPSNGSATLDVAHKGGIAPPTAALGAARKSNVLYTYEPPVPFGPPVDLGGEWADKTEAVARPPINHSAALDVVWKEGIVHPTAALDTAHENNIRKARPVCRINATSAKPVAK
ncbi:hypothetical protein DFH08DRAFT_823363 [Mycena albidolilacea]|uniref:Uncharacterized protein n=1 Tax=Mycena albidolilacea TaxID=1033008 RepID=A0AAD6Z6T0_9AGAR|nr:hypothetical protein DFH08DRAFT_823363 [Mycena albidolilacea]